MNVVYKHFILNYMKQFIWIQFVEFPVLKGIGNLQGHDYLILYILSEVCRIKGSPDLYHAFNPSAYIDGHSYH